MTEERNMKNQKKEFDHLREHKGVERLLKKDKADAGRKRISGSERGAAEILENIFSSTQVLFAYLDTSFNFIRVNRAYAGADGRTPEYFVGKNHFDLYPDKENERIFRNAVETGHIHSVREKPFVYANRPERGVTYWDWNLIPVKSAAGKVEGLLLCLFDVSKRVHIEEALRKSEAHFRRVFDESPLGAAIVGLDYHFRRVNEEYCRITGYSAEELTSMSFVDITHPDDLKVGIEQARALATGKIDHYQLEERYVRKDGKPVWVRLFARLIRDENGTPLYFMPLVEDITERKRAEEQLKSYRENLEQMVEERTAELAEVNANLQLEVIEHQQADAELREINENLVSVLSSISDGFFALDNQMNVTYFNKAAEEVLDKKAEEVVGRNLFDVFPEARGTIFQEKYAQAILYRKPIAFESYFGPHESWYDVRVYPYKDGISVYFQITNERKKAQEALRQSEEKLRLLTDALPVLISYIDSEQRFRFNNRHFEAWFGRARSEFSGKHVRKVIGESAYERIRPHLERALSGSPARYEAVVEDFRGERKFIEGVYVPHFDRQGKVLGCFALISDITNRKHTEIALRESEGRYRELAEHLEQKVEEKVAELKQAETLASIGRMVSVVAHEVRNPLQNINMGVEMLGMEIKQKEAKMESLEEIQHGVGILNGIISELLNYVRPIALQVAPIELGSLIQRSLTMVENKLRNISVVTDLDQPGKEIRVDSTKLIQVLVNLLSNAADAMPHGGKITISSSFLVDFLHLRIIDTGHGISEQDLNSIFDPFFTTKARGTGLGLPLCKKIVEAHGGCLEIRSKAGEGTIAEILIPLNATTLTTTLM